LAAPSSAGSEDKVTTSVQLTDEYGDVVWSYSLNKGRGTKNRQSMAESSAEHPKDDHSKKLRQRTADHASNSAAKNSRAPSGPVSVSTMGPPPGGTVN
jgi:hypothetical protein